MAGGRPTDYTLKLTDIICARLSSGESMRSVCRDDDMPVLTTIFRWLREKPEFKQQYDIAKEESAEAHADEMLFIADHETGQPLMVDGEPVMVDGKPVMVVDAPAIAHAKLRIDTRKWSASKLKRKKYGEFQTITGDTENPVHIVNQTKEEYLAARQELLDSDEC